jgi:HAMP domain-containing protein
LFVFAGPRRFESVLGEHCVIGTPLFDENGHPKRILVATISLETLHRIFGFFTFEDFDSWMVVNTRSIIIFHDDPAMAGLSERGEYGKTFLEDVAFGDREVFVRIMRNGWKMVTFLESSELLEPYRQAYRLIVWFSVFLAFILAVFVLILSAAVARPIRALNEGVHRIMAGDYGQEVRVSTGDELADLAETFNRLSRRMVSLRTEDGPRTPKTPPRYPPRHTHPRRRRKGQGSLHRYHR